MQKVIGVTFTKRQREKMGSNNTVCRNFDYNEKAGGILELISLNCKECEFNGHCDIKSAYEDAKNNAASIEFVEDITGSEVENDD